MASMSSQLSLQTTQCEENLFPEMETASFLAGLSTQITEVMKDSVTTVIIEILKGVSEKFEIDIKELLSIASDVSGHWGTEIEKKIKTKELNETKRIARQEQKAAAPKCEYIKRGGEKCGVPALHEHDNKHYCRSHFSVAQKNNGTHKCEYVLGDKTKRSGENCNKKADEEINGKWTCKQHIASFEKERERQEHQCAAVYTKGANKDQQCTHIAQKIGDEWTQYCSRHQPKETKSTDARKAALKKLQENTEKTEENSGSEKAEMENDTESSKTKKSSVKSSIKSTSSEKSTGKRKKKVLSTSASSGELHITNNFAHEKKPEFVMKKISLNEGDEPDVVGWVDKHSGMVCINKSKPNSEHKPRDIAKLHILGVWNNERQNVDVFNEESSEAILHAEKFNISKAELSEESEL